MKWLKYVGKIDKDFNILESIGRNKKGNILIKVTGTNLNKLIVSMSCYDEVPFLNEVLIRSE